MAVTAEEAREAVEDVFDFDHVGDAMSALRRNLDSKEAREALVDALTKCAAAEFSENSPEDIAAFKIAAGARVGFFIEGAKYSQSGCSKV